MRISTIQLSQWRMLKDTPIMLLDATVKTGDKIFAPNWEIVIDVKSGRITEEEYTRRYTEKMRASYKSHKFHWLEQLKQEHFAIACFCTPGDFCHRHILAKMFEAVGKAEGIEVKLMGEITKDNLCQLLTVPELTKSKKQET
jgi:uncharacterized protein YeaO (DUF488 family)